MNREELDQLRREMTLAHLPNPLYRGTLDRSTNFPRSGHPSYPVVKMCGSDLDSLIDLINNGPDEAEERLTRGGTIHFRGLEVLHDPQVHRPTFEPRNLPIPCGAD